MRARPGRTGPRYNSSVQFHDGGRAAMTLQEDKHYTFRFGDDRIIPRFHLEGVPSHHLGWIC